MNFVNLHNPSGQKWPDVFPELFTGLPASNFPQYELIHPGDAQMKYKMFFPLVRYR
jgi:hypothetical protein